MDTPQPLLATLVPAFKLKYLGELLAALERQTLKSDFVLLSDDTPGGDFIAALASPELRDRAAALKVQAIEGPRRGATANLHHVLAAWGGRSRYLHLLFDDDLVYPDFYERHLGVLRSGDYAASVSLRWVADERGVPLERARIPPPVLAHPQRTLTLDARTAFATTVGTGVNWLGEFSNAVLRADMAGFVAAPLLAGVPLYGLEDLACFLAAATRAPLVLVNEHLGCFRTSPQQNTAQVQGLIMKLSTCAWLPLALAGERLGHLAPAEVRRCLQTIGPMVVNRYHDDAALAPLVAATAAWLQGDDGAAPRALQAWQDYVAAQVPQHAAAAAPASAPAPTV